MEEDVENIRGRKTRRGMGYEKSKIVQKARHATTLQLHIFTFIGVYKCQKKREVPCSPNMTLDKHVIRQSLMPNILHSAFFSNKVLPVKNWQQT